MATLRRTSQKILLLAVLSGSLPAIADEITFEGSTSGAFATPMPELTFTGANFGPFLTSDGSLTLTDLGTFTLVAAASSAIHLSGNFNLTFAFTVPGGAGTRNYAGTVGGIINQNNVNNFTINFHPNREIVLYSGGNGPGAFFLTIDNVTLPNATRVKGGPVTTKLTGSISSSLPSSILSGPSPETSLSSLIALLENGSSPSSPAAAVSPLLVSPEPTSISVLFTGVVILLYMIRRRHQSRNHFVRSSEVLHALRDENSRRIKDRTREDPRPAFIMGKMLRRN